VATRPKAKRKTKTNAKAKRKGKMRGLIGGRHHDPLIESQGVGLSERLFWPKGKAMPSTVKKMASQLIPCPECERVLLDDGGRSSVCTSGPEDVNYYRCKCCGHRWKLPVERVEPEG